MSTHAPYSRRHPKRTYTAAPKQRLSQKEQEDDKQNGHNNQRDAEEVPMVCSALRLERFHCCAVSGSVMSRLNTWANNFAFVWLSGCAPRFSVSLHRGCSGIEPHDLISVKPSIDRATLH